MLIEYKIKFEDGGLTITQRVETGGAKLTPVAPQVEPPGLEVLPAKRPEPAGAAGAGHAPDIKPADPGGGNGVVPGEGGGNGVVPGEGGGNGVVPGEGGGGGQGEMVVFGPIVIDASCLIRKKAEPPKE